MKFLTEHNSARAGALATIMALGALGPYELHSSSPEEEQTRKLLIQGSSVETLVALVQGAGGTVSHQLDLMKAVGVEVSDAQLRQISISPDVHRIIDDGTLAINSYAQCSVSGEHVFEAGEDGSVVWTLSSRNDLPATLSSVEFSWPEELGSLRSLTYSGMQLASQVSGGVVSVSAADLPAFGARRALHGRALHPGDRGVVYRRSVRACIGRRARRQDAPDEIQLDPDPGADRPEHHAHHSDGRG